MTGPIADPASDAGWPWLFQSYASFPHNDVRQNMEFGMRSNKVDPVEARPRIHDGRARSLQLTDYLERASPRNFRAARRQRVAIGRAIVKSPKVFLFDEPLSNLDAQAALQDARRNSQRPLHKQV